MLVSPDQVALNFVEHATWALKGCARARVCVETDLVLVDSGIESDTFNLACRARLSAASARARIDEAIDFLMSENRPFTFWVLPGDGPPDLPRLLTEAGLAEVGTETAMVLDLASHRTAAPSTGIDIRRVSTREDLAAFADVCAANSTPPDPYVAAYYRLTERAFLDCGSPQRLYLGCVDERPVATAEVAIAAGVAGLYNISTLAQFRGRGVGGAMTSHCLEQAKRLGMQSAVLQASTEGEPVYRRLGFSATGLVTEYKPRSGREAMA